MIQPTGPVTKKAILAIGLSHKVVKNCLTVSQCLYKIVPATTNKLIPINNQPIGQAAIAAFTNIIPPLHSFVAKATVLCVPARSIVFDLNTAVQFPKVVCHKAQVAINAL